MLIKMVKKRTFLILSSLIILLIVYLFPTKKEDKTYIQNENTDFSIVYLIDQNNLLSRVSVITKNTNIDNQIKEITEYLTDGSNKKDYLSDGFKPVIPKGTKLLYFKIDDDLLTLNFSKKLLTITEEDEKKLISSLVYTYTSIDGINKITIYVEGNLLDRLPNSNEKIPQIIDKSYGINQIYNITDIIGTTKTTIYYLSKYKDYYYYVPVTLINNDKSDKVEIILSELASKSVYETSLISYLKDVREISYEMENDFISLNMSKKLFNDLYESNLIEKVIYTINLSIKNNYEHKKVIYYIDNELYKTYDF